MIRTLLVFVLAMASSLVIAQSQVPTSQSQIALSFAPLVKETAPAVVNIYAKRVTQTVRRNPFMDDPFFERFFNNFPNPEPRVQDSLGSGVILSGDGIVVSNYHVVGMATEIRVVLNDRREFSARVLLGDEANDLAILKLDDAEDLPFLTLRNSDTVEVGELVLAIGNPFGVGQTVSSGIVSGLARSGAANGMGRGYFIQTDAPINPGNSGGALVDISGALIGVNTSILTRSGGSNGIGFAIPANLVSAYVRQAQQGNTSFERPWAGLSGQTVDNELAEMAGLDRAGGIILSGLHPASPFAVAGFDVGDIITAIDGQSVNTPPEMIFRMSVAGEGTTITVTRLRDGESEDVPVRLILAPEEPPRDTLRLSDRYALPGLIVSQINPAIISEMGLSAIAEGVIVEDPGSYGQRVGLRRGDILQRVSGMIIAHPKDLLRAMPAWGDRARLDILRGDRRLFVRF